jgi:hypothetical protein
MPVAQMESIRLLLAMVVAAAKVWRVHHMDVKSAFLNSELSEVVFIMQAPGFIIEG